MSVVKVPQTEASHGLEVGSVPCSQTQPVFDGSCRNDGVGQTDAALSTDSASAFRHRAIDRDLPERGKESADQIGGSVARKELGSGDDRVTQSVTAGNEPASASEVVDEDVGVDEDVSHDPIHPGSAPWRPELRRTWPPAPTRDRVSRPRGMSRERAG